MMQTVYLVPRKGASRLEAEVHRAAFEARVNELLELFKYETRTGTADNFIKHNGAIVYVKHKRVKAFKAAANLLGIGAF